MFVREKSGESKTYDCGSHLVGHCSFKFEPILI